MRYYSKRFTVYYYLSLWLKKKKKSENNVCLGEQLPLLLKPRVRDKRLYGTGTSGLMLIIFGSDICVRASQYVSKGTSLRRKNMDISLAHTQCSGAIAQPIPIRLSQWQCWRVGEHQMVCGDWLVCQSIYVCNNPIACTARILARAFRAYVCSDVIRTAYFELRTVLAMDLRSCSLARWTGSLRIQQHIVWNESEGST